MDVLIAADDTGFQQLDRTFAEGEGEGGEDGGSENRPERGGGCNSDAAR